MRGCDWRDTMDRTAARSAASLRDGGDMVERREMLGGGLLAGLAGAITTASTVGAAGDGAVEDTRKAAAGAVDRLRASLEREATPGTVSPSVAAIRQQQRTYIRSHDK